MCVFLPIILMTAVTILDGPAIGRELMGNGRVNDVSACGSAIQKHGYAAWEAEICKRGGIVYPVFHQRPPNLGR